MQIPSNLRNVTCVLIMLFLCSPACSVRPPAEAPTLRAWGPDGSGDVIEDRGDPNTLDFSHGVIHHYQPGDVVDLVMNINGDILRAAEPATLNLHVQRPLWIYVGPRTQPLASFDGEHWAPIWDAANGAIALGFSMNVEVPRNITTLDVRAEAP